MCLIAGFPYFSAHNQQYPTRIIETRSVAGKIYRNSEIIHFDDINQVALPLLNLAAHWESNNTEACDQKLSQILANIFQKLSFSLDFNVTMASRLIQGQTSTPDDVTCKSHFYEVLFICAIFNKRALFCNIWVNGCHKCKVALAIFTKHLC